MGGALVAYGLYLALNRGRVARFVQTSRNGEYSRRSLADIDQITLHHTAGPPTQTAEDIARFHLQRGWPGIGYHFLVYPDGTVQQVNDLETVSYHNGATNGRAVGISMPGNYDANRPTDKQIAAVVALTRALKRRLPNLRHFSGHKELNRPTACPGRYVDLPALRRRVGLSAVPVGQTLAAANAFTFTPQTGVAWDEDN